MTQAELIKLHDHLVAHYNAHGAEESAEQISTIEKLLLASIAGNASSAAAVFIEKSEAALFHKRRLLWA
jgi:hypothetical protein